MSGRHLFPCVACARPMWFPQSKVGKYKTCSEDCALSLREQARADRTRACETCATLFAPRPLQIRSGGGLFCSQACNTRGRDALKAPEARRKAIAHRAILQAEGRIKYRRGADSASWRGGREAAKKRHAPARAEYKRANKGKVAAWAANRRKRGAGKLPSDIVAVLMAAQRRRCAACRASLLMAGRHLDHITALANGGRNEGPNMQLLCPACNTKKGAKPPEQFMREMGFLL